MPFADAAYDQYFRRPRWEQELPSFPIINMGQRLPDALEEELQPLPYTTDMFSMLSQKNPGATLPTEPPPPSPVASAPRGHAPEPSLGGQDATGMWSYGGKAPAMGTGSYSGPRYGGAGSEILNTMERIHGLDARTDELGMQRRVSQARALKDLEDALMGELQSNRTPTPERMAYIDALKSKVASAREIVNNNSYDKVLAERRQANAPIDTYFKGLETDRDKRRQETTDKAISDAILGGGSVTTPPGGAPIKPDDAKKIADAQRQRDELDRKKKSDASLTELRQTQIELRRRTLRGDMSPEDMRRNLDSQIKNMAALQQTYALSPTPELKEMIDLSNATIKALEEGIAKASKAQPIPTQPVQPTQDMNFIERFLEGLLGLGGGSEKPAQAPMPESQNFSQPGVSPTPSPQPQLGPNAQRQAQELAVKVNQGTATPQESQVHARLMNIYYQALKDNGGNKVAAKSIAARAVFGDR